MTERCDMRWSKTVEVLRRVQSVNVGFGVWMQNLECVDAGFGVWMWGLECVDVGFGVWM